MIETIGNRAPLWLRRFRACAESPRRSNLAIVFGSFRKRGNPSIRSARRDSREKQEKKNPSRRAISAGRCSLSARASSCLSRAALSWPCLLNLEVQKISYA